MKVSGDGGRWVSDQVSRSAVDVCGYLTGVLFSIALASGLCRFLRLSMKCEGSEEMEREKAVLGGDSLLGLEITACCCFFTCNIFL